MDDTAPSGFQFMRAVLHVHHMEGLDVGHAGREDQICVTLHKGCLTLCRSVPAGSEGAAARRNSAIMRPSSTRISSREFPMDEILRRSALEYHLRQPPGKISVTPTKGLLNQRDLEIGRAHV